jgi:hypothetical protein
MPAPPQSAQSHPVPLWPLALVAGLLPVTASTTAFWLSVSADYIPACNPLVEGCVSISRAARHGLGNHVFRALMLPAATLQAITWLLATRWLLDLGAGGRSMKWLPWLGVIAGLFLVLYGTFLGTEGEAYRWLRRYGVIVYFGFTYMSMLITAAQLRTLADRTGAAIPAWLGRALLILLAGLLLMGLFNFFVRPLVADEPLQNRIENSLEWFSGLGFTIYFLALAWIWRRTGFGARFHGYP